MVQTGRPNVDWCEDHKLETIRANLIGALLLADVCTTLGVHLTFFSTGMPRGYVVWVTPLGCLYTYDEAHPRDYAVKETDEPNFAGSFYSFTKGIVDKVV